MFLMRVSQMSFEEVTMVRAAGVPVLVLFREDFGLLWEVFSVFVFLGLSGVLFDSFSLA